MTAETPAAPPVVAPPKKKRGVLIAVILVLLLAVAGTLFALLKPGGNDSVRLGVVGASDPYWPVFVEEAAKAGIDVTIIDFADYNQANPATSEGEIELNQFQHLVYLAEYNVKSGDDLQPVGATAIYPLGLYSTQYGSAAEIPDGATIAVPNDPSNRARALLVLQSAGLIELAEGGTIFSTPDDVLPSSRVSVTELDAAVVATSLTDVAAGVINNDFVARAGLSFEDAIAQDDPTDPNALPYVNVFVATKANADSEVSRKLVEIYQNSQAVLDGVSAVSDGTAVFPNTPVADLRAALTKVEADTKAQNQ